MRHDTPVSRPASMPQPVSAARDHPEQTDTPTPVVENPWAFLRHYTTARIGLGRAGTSLPTRHHLAFQQAHAQARDAVHTPLDVPELRAQLVALGVTPVHLHSAAPDRATYLQRPDLGRRLAPASAEAFAGVLAAAATTNSNPPAGSDATPGFDVVFIVADGLSALAVQRHAAALLRYALAECPAEWRIAPVAVVEQGRVAISDDIGSLARARLAVILIGERPGLSSPDSLGVYMTYAPAPGNTDANRNCLSNIREAGLSYEDAARKLGHLMRNAWSRRMSGVHLKDETTTVDALTSGGAPSRGANFLLHEPD